MATRKQLLTLKLFENDEAKVKASGKCAMHNCQWIDGCKLFSMCLCVDMTHSLDVMHVLVYLFVYNLFVTWAVIWMGAEFVVNLLQDVSAIFTLLLTSKYTSMHSKSKREREREGGEAIRSCRYAVDVVSSVIAVWLKRTLAGDWIY